MKVQVKFPFTAEIDGNQKTFMPRDMVESTKIDSKLFEALKLKGFFIEVQEKLVESKKDIPVGATEVKFENPKDVIVAKPEEKKEEPKTEAHKSEESKSMPITEQPARKGRANRN